MGQLAGNTTACGTSAAYRRVRIPSGHLAVISHRDEVARLIETAAKGVQAEIKWSGR